MRATKYSRFVLEVPPPTYEVRKSIENELRQHLPTYLHSIDTIIIPEIRDLDEFGRLNSDRVLPLEFAQWIKEIYPNPLILTRAVAYDIEDEHKIWMEKVQKLGSNQIVLAGRHSHDVPYLTTLERAAQIAKEYNMSCGAIVIPSRENEPTNLKNKLVWADFLQTQILYDYEKMIDLMREFSNSLPFLYANLAPITKKAHIDFLKKYPPDGLRVHLPENVEKRLREAENISDTSWEIELEVYERIMEAAKELNITDKIGFIISYLRLSNMELAFELAKEIKTRLLNPTVDVPSAYI